MNKVKNVKVCNSCGSENVWSDASAAWDSELQEWVLLNVFDNEWCDDCDGECKIVDATTEPASVVYSSHGEFFINKNSGIVISEHIADTEDSPKGAVRFDIKEYCAFYKKSPSDAYDILDLGYWMEDGTYEEPCHDWRTDVIQLRAEGI
jgi:hypothetical protein